MTHDDDATTNLSRVLRDAGEHDIASDLTFADLASALRASRPTIPDDPALATLIALHVEHARLLAYTHGMLDALESQPTPDDPDRTKLAARLRRVLNAQDPRTEPT